MVASGGGAGGGKWCQWSLAFVCPVVMVGSMDEEQNTVRFRISYFS